MKLIKQDQQRIEQRNDRGQTRLNEDLQTMVDPLEATNDCDQGERSLHHHAVIPYAFCTQFAVLWRAAFLAKAVISRDDATPTELQHKRLELIVRDIHRIPIPGHHLSKAIENPAQLDATAPTAFIPGFFAELLRVASFSNGKQQFDRIAINHQEKARICQKALVPILMRGQQPLQSGNPANRASESRLSQR